MIVTEPPTDSSARVVTDPAPEPTDHQTGHPSGPRAYLNGRGALVIIALLTLFGALPRLWNLGVPSFWNDEGASALFALAALKSGLPILPNLPGAIRIVNFDPLYAEIEAGAFGLFGVSPLVARIPAVIFGILTIPAAFLLGRRLKDPYVGIALAVMVAFSTEYIAWSRQARGYSLFILLLVVVTLAILYRPESPTRQRRWLLAGVVACCFVLCGFASPGLALLYIPGVLAGIGAFCLVRWRARVGAFLGVRRTGAGLQLEMHNARVWLRRIVLLVILGVVVVACLFPPALLSGVLARLFQAVLGYAPYRFVIIQKYATYLLSYYSLVTYLAALGALLVVYDHRETEVAVLAFFLGTLLTLSTLLSYVVNAAGGAPVYERYLTPLLVFLFYFCARALVWIGLLVWRKVRVLHPLGSTRLSRNALVAVSIAVLVIVPATIVPTGLNTYPLTNFSPADSLVPWVPFTPWPSDPSALYGTPQPNFVLATNYVLAHRSSSDVVMAIWPEAPAFYLGTVQYWAYSNPPPGSAIAVPGGYEYYLTGSKLVPNVNQFESLVGNSSGWFLLDTNAIGALATNLSLAVSSLLTLIPSASDNSIALYHWDKSSDNQLLLQLSAHRPDLQLAFNGNLTELINWATIYGVTVDSDRGILLPMEWTLTNETNSTDRPMAVLLSVYNERPDLQARYPEVLAGNFTRLLHWAAEVLTGSISDPAETLLAQYTSYYVGASESTGWTPPS